MIISLFIEAWVFLISKTIFQTIFQLFSKNLLKIKHSFKMISKD
jgi:hypothetical protein